MNTDLRLSSLHFAISSGVSSLILFAPGAWLWGNTKTLISEIENPERRDTEWVVSLTFFQWILTIFSWAMKLQSGTEHCKKAFDGFRSKCAKWFQIITLSKLSRLPWHAGIYVHRIFPGFWSLCRKSHRKMRTLVPSCFSAQGLREKIVTLPCLWQQHKMR